jgi:hypothetical protein
MKNYFYFYFTNIICVVMCVVMISEVDNCITHKGTAGVCKIDKECDWLSKNLKLKTMNHAQIVRCGFEGLDPIVCCELPEASTSIVPTTTSTTSTTTTTTPAPTTTSTTTTPQIIARRPVIRTTTSSPHLRKSVIGKYTFQRPFHNVERNTRQSFFKSLNLKIKIWPCSTRLIEIHKKKITLAMVRGRVSPGNVDKQF